ncbi:MAG: G5 domain-containing protein [Candidatus Desulforudaceae bacterium]
MSPATPSLRIRKRKAHRPSLLGLAIFLIGIFVLAGFWNSSGAWSVSFDGEQVAFVGETEEVDNALTRIAREYGGLTPADRARVKLVRVPRPGEPEYASVAELERRLIGAYGFVGEAVAMSIDGNVKMYFKNREEANAFLDQLKVSYIVEQNCESVILETIELAPVTVARAEVIDREGAWRLYKSRTKDDQEHEIKNGDTLWDVAVKYGVTVEQLLKSNPGVKPDSILALGSKLVISKQEPLLTVVTRAEIVETRAIPFQVKVERDNKLAMGQRKVIEPGKPGREDVTFIVTRQNGRLVERERIDTVQLEPPKTQVEVRGAMLMVASRQGSGQLAWPVRGGISSPQLRMAG